MPETAYIRKATPAVSTEHQTVASKEELAHDASHAEYNELEEPPTPKRFTFIQNLRIYHGVLTTEPLFKLFVRPLGLLILPPVLWAALVMAVTIGFLVAIASNFATAFATTYGFQTYQAGLCFISALIGSMIGLVFGGIVTDKVTDLFVQRNGGVKEPEMRLPSIALTFVTAPVALVLYGVGIGYHLHWIVPTVGIGLCTYPSLPSVQAPHFLTRGSEPLNRARYKRELCLYDRFIPPGWRGAYGYSVDLQRYVWELPPTHMVS